MMPGFAIGMGKKIGEVKHEQLPQVVMAKDFDSAWKTYSCHPSLPLGEAGSGEHFSQIMDRAAEEVLTFIRQLLTMQEKNSRQESMQEAFRSQVEEQAKLWQEALHGSETMKAQIRQMILYHSLCEAKKSI